MPPLGFDVLVNALPAAAPEEYRPPAGRVEDLPAQALTFSSRAASNRPFDEQARRTRLASPGAPRMSTAAAPEYAADARADPILRLEGVRKSFGDNLVLDGIDLEVPTGEVLVVIGPSGSGKSTLLRCVNLLEPIQAGRIFFEGDEITAKGADVASV